MTKDLVNDYYSACLRTDVPAGIKALYSAQLKSQTAKLRVLRRKVDRRFQSKTENLQVRCSDPLVKAVVGAYREYYRAALLDVNHAKRHEAVLKARVREIALQFGIKSAAKAKWENVENLLAKSFRERGFFSLFGRVTPFCSLLVWRSQRTKRHTVKLASGIQRVKVVFLDEFVDLGWMHFATLGRYYVGGWAKKDALYCVSQAYRYNFSGEAFRTSYLTHEAQHFSDYKKFPGLPQADLEYRAKLAEIIASSRPARVLRKIDAEARNDPSLPHCFAAYNIREKLKGNRQKKRAQDLAIAALAEHTQKLRQMGKTLHRGALRVSRL